MPEKVYLDDHGNPITTKVYLDDNGEPLTGGKPEEKSVLGFVKNVGTSGVKFAKDTAQGLYGAAKFLGDITPGAPMDRQVERGRQTVEMARNAPRILSAAWQGAKNRYGSLDAIKNTAYTDPVGMAADASTVLDPAAWGAEAAGLTKTAGALSKAAEFTNPMRAVGAATEAVAKPLANGVIRSTLRPPAEVRADFGGSKAIADGVLKDRVYSEASAGRKLDRSVSQADSMLADAQAAGTPGVPAQAVADAVLHGPQKKATLRTRLGVPDASQGLQDTANSILKNNPAEIPLTDAQSMKREAQQLAYEAGADNQSVTKAAEIAKAQALRGGIESRVPEVGPVNEQSQRLLGSKLAFGKAEDRPRALTNFLSVLGGVGGFVGGGPTGATVAPLLIKAMDSPRAGAMAGIGLNEFGHGMNAESVRRAAILARLLEQVPNQ